MKMTTPILKSGSLALLMGLLVLFAVGCGSETNPEFQEPVGDVHPFGDLENHGSYLVGNGYDFSACVECHGTTTDGLTTLGGQEAGAHGTNVRSCYKCHNENDHQILFTAAMEHAQALRTQGWDINNCYSCHTATPVQSGIEFGGSCSSTQCHSATADGPNACNTCHGDFYGDPEDPASWAPPQGIWATSVTDPGIGAHQAHLNPVSGWFEPMPCNSCHWVPSVVNTRRHIDSETPDRTEVTLKALAAENHSNPVYNAADASCSSVYCHGDATPVWTQMDGTFRACGSCHTLPPAAPHIQDSNCSACHAQVVDASLNIIAPELHLNGRVEVQVP